MKKSLTIEDLKQKIGKPVFLAKYKNKLHKNPDIC